MQDVRSFRPVSRMTTGMFVGFQRISPESFQLHRTNPDLTAGAWRLAFFLFLSAALPYSCKRKGKGWKCKQLTKQMIVR